MFTRFFESLETRRMLAASVSSGLLTVTGTSGSDTVSVTRLSDGRWRVNDNGTLRTFASSAVSSIKVDAGAGSDLITISNSITLPTTLLGGSGNDTIRGGGGKDSIVGGDGNDKLFGRNANDSLKGGNGHDSLYGGSGLDLLMGEAGNDVLVSVGGGQFDVLNGGDGSDVYWADSEGTEIVASSSSEQSRGAVHRISKFKDLRVVRGFLNETTTTVSRELNAQNLPDPVAPTSTADLSNNPLFATTAPTFTDINQGAVGDCYFLATVGAIAKAKPSFLTRNAVDLGDGTYAVRFKGLFGNEYLRVDADLPTALANGQLPRAALGAQNALWVAIYEKAFTFFRKNEGTYASIEGGLSGEALDALGISNDFYLSGWDKNGLLNRIRNELNAGRAITASTPSYGGGTGSPVVGGHVYIVDSVVVSSSGAVTQVRLYNPWGTDGGDAALADGTNDGFVTLTGTQFYNNFISFNSAVVS